VKWILSLAVIAFGFSASNNFFRERPMFMKTPTYADGLDMYGIPSIEKKNISGAWIARAFSIKDLKIRDAILESIQQTPGPCPCPYLRYTRGNRRCGGNSSYTQGGGSEPICYPADLITKK
jgi:hypothetical protein